MDSVTPGPDGLVAHVRSMSPGPGCVVTGAVTAPAVAVAAPLDSMVRFSETAYEWDCD